MATVTEEELQAREFLKRAEVRTMKKDLLALREVDALKERDKIATIKTLEEQQAEQAKKLQEKEVLEKTAREEVLGKNAGQEKIAAKDLKSYATEEERQQIFLLESQRFGFGKQIDDIDKVKDPAFKLEKNKLLIQKREWQEKLNSILDKEKKLVGEQNFISQKEQTTTIPSERKGLESRRWDLDKEIQDIEKKRWEIEKQAETVDGKITQIDRSSEQLVIEKNELQNKALGIDKSLREIYSTIIEREEEKRRGLSQEQMARKKELADVRLAEKEKIQRQQWSPTPAKKPAISAEYLSKAPPTLKEKLTSITSTEEEQRNKFLRNVESWAQDKDKLPAQVQAQENMVPVPKARTENKSEPLTPPIPPAPHKK